jgi:hypothetical protein
MISNLPGMDEVLAAEFVAVADELARAASPCTKSSTSLLCGCYPRSVKCGTLA